MSAVRTRQQREMALALGHVRDVQQRLSAADAAVYGRLCLQLPALVQTNGLCQALAFLEDKGKGRAPYQRLLDHLAELLGVERRELLNHVRDADLRAYMQMTRRTLSAWVYYKRFSGSLLGAEYTDDVEAG